MEFQCKLGDGIWSNSGIQSLADKFLIFHSFWPKIVEQIIEFSKKILCNIESVALSACPKVMHISRNEEQLRQCLQ